MAANLECPPIRLMEPSWWPLAEGMVERGPLPIATFASQFSSQADTTAAAADIDFLETLDVSRVMPEGASDNPTLVLLVQPAPANGGPYSADNLPTPASLVADFRPNDFRSAIPDMNAHPPLQYLGYGNFGCCDEIHTDKSKQYIFSVDEEPVESGDMESDMCALDIRAAHEAALAEIKQYVFGCDMDMSSDVLLLAVGVSPSTGNLVGVITKQICHNLCD